MFFAVTQKIKIVLVLLSVAGIFLGLFCALNHHSGVSAHSSTSKSVVLLAQGNEECCGTSLLKLDHTLVEALLTAKNHSQDLYRVLATGLIFVSVIIGRRIFEHFEQYLAFFVRLCMRKNLEIFALRYLRLAFSRGILNAKKYNVAFSC